ncbi:MAG: leucine--tRNA ligase, partial [Actinobacteria bacterium]
FATHTALAAVIELVNELYKERDSSDPSHVRFAIATAASLVFPFAPHLGSEVYEQLTGRRVWEEPWPQADRDLLVADTVALVVQMNGKLIDRLQAPADASEEEQERIARESEKLAARLDGREIVKTVVVPGKLVNFVVR